MQAVDTMETILLILLLAAATFLTLTVLFQKSKEDGLSSTIVGGTETYYGKDKAGKNDKRLRKWTMIISILFIAAVLLVYFLQPDYIAMAGAEGWKELTSFATYFKS